MNALVLQSDFGYVDGAVSAMYGVALGVTPDLRVHDLTHNIPPYDIWEGSYRLAQVLPYWAEGTVFVSVVDPGVGSDRLSIVARTRGGHLVVTPNNGTLTHVHQLFGVQEIRVIDEQFNRREGSAHSYTFHGRDIYAYTGARLASGVISYDQVGPERSLEDLELLPVVEPTVSGAVIRGTIDAHDNRYGSLWTSIPRPLFVEAGIEHGDHVRLTIEHNGQTVHATSLVYAPSFAHVQVGETLIYVNSLDRIAVAINRGSYASAFHLGRGTSWHVSFEKVAPVGP